MYKGMSETREWLEHTGFRIAPYKLSFEGNQCDWLAYKPTKLAARECECNEGKRLQIIIFPSHLILDTDFKKVAVDVTGEAGGVWYKLEAYSLSEEELKSQLPEVEEKLVRAWNALAG
jgi:hypothetical protein